jgi:hypothetical protein
VVLKAHKTNRFLPPGYKLDYDPNIVILRRGDGSVAAYFPAWSFEPILALEETEVDLARGGYAWGKDKQCEVRAVAPNT